MVGLHIPFLYLLWVMSLVGAMTDFLPPYKSEFNACRDRRGIGSDRITLPTPPLATMLSRPALQQASTLARASLRKQDPCLCAALKSLSCRETTAAYSTSTQRGENSS